MELPETKEVLYPQYLAQWKAVSANKLLLMIIDYLRCYLIKNGIKDVEEKAAINICLPRGRLVPRESHLKELRF